MCNYIAVVLKFMSLDKNDESARNKQSRPARRDAKQLFIILHYRYTGLVHCTHLSTRRLLFAAAREYIQSSETCNGRGYESSIYIYIHTVTYTCKRTHNSRRARFSCARAFLGILALYSTVAVLLSELELSTGVGRCKTLFVCLIPRLM